MDSNYLGWSSAMAPVIMGNADRPELGEELTNSFCRADPEIAAPVRARRRSCPTTAPTSPRVTHAEPGAAVLATTRSRPRRSASTSHARAARAAGSCSSRRPATARTSARPRRRSRRSGRSSPRDDRRRARSRTRRRSCSRTRPAATCRRASTGRSSGSTARSRRGPGCAREELLGGRRFQDLLTPGGRIYHETHYAPLLQMQGVGARDRGRDRARRRVAPARADQLGPAPRRATAGRASIRTTVFDATDRRRYEQELLRAAPARAGDRPAAAAQPAVGRAARRRRASTSRSPTGPAVRGLEVGGDWYDAFWLDDEPRRSGSSSATSSAAASSAAATMGQLRSAVRALASTGLGPAALLDALDGYARAPRRRAHDDARLRASSSLASGRAALRVRRATRRRSSLGAGRARPLRLGGPLAAARRAPARRRPARRGDAARSAPAARCCSTPTASIERRTRAAAATGSTGCSARSARTATTTPAALVRALVRTLARRRARRRRVRARGARPRR